jgi:hypothetical protein
MRNFLTIAQGVDTQPVLQALHRNGDLWNQHTIRTDHPETAHGAVSDILVWFNDLRDPQAVINDREVVPYPAWERLPQLRPLIFGLMRQVDAVRLGRVIITRLPPGKSIVPHVDGGAPATYYDRYQVMLQCLPGVQFHCGYETLNAKTGDVFMFQNELEHSVVNNSADDRIVCIVDLKSA